MSTASSSKKVSFVEHDIDAKNAAAILMSMSASSSTASIVSKPYVGSCGLMMERKDFIVMQKITSTGHFAKLDKVVENIFCAVLKTTPRHARMMYKMFQREKAEIESWFS
jgi:hypothetical protein